MSVYVVEVDLEDDLVMFVTNGKLEDVLNTSVFAGILEPGTSTGFDESAAVSVQVGAGGPRVTVSAGRRSRSLMAPVAPYTFVLSPG
jgi:hypothetical protein